MTFRYALTWLCAALACAGLPAMAQSPDASKSAAILKSIRWQEGPGTASVERWAEVQLKAGYIFANGKDTQKLMSLMGNLVSGAEAGYLAPTNADWFIVFEFDESGYVKDDEKTSLDANALLTSIKESAQRSNVERRKRGLEEMFVDGWAIPPRYNETTHNLEWAVRFVNKQGEPIVNHNVRILGRRGVMQVTLVVDPAALDGTLPEFYDCMSRFQFTQGNRYAEFVKGDKVAAYGLSALVLGGAAAVAVKTGLLQKLWKPIVIGFIALAGFFKKMIGRLMGRDKQP